VALVAIASLWSAPATGQASLADFERDLASMAARPDTIYHLASVTKPYAATVVLQFVEEGKLDLTERISLKLDLKRTGPNPRRIPGPRPPGVAPDRTFEQSGLDYRTIEGPLAMGYRRSEAGSMTPMPHPTYLFAAAGLVASAPDVARFSIALDQGRFLTPATFVRACTPGTLVSGAEFPYGLGWFVQTFQGSKLVWHFGQGLEGSALLLRIPDRQLAFVILANSEGLSRAVPLGDYGDVLRSPVARLFLKWGT
jgi:CubicO group peptidase (beta-lactamase class C family)